MAATLTVLCASCGGGGGGAAPLTAPKGGYAADKSDPTAVAWFKKHTAVVAGLGSAPVITSATSANYSALSAECLSYGDAVTAAKHLPEVPQPSAQALWAYALRQLSAGVAFCSAGVAKMDATDITDAGLEFTEGHQTLAYLIFGTPIPKSPGA